MMHTALWAIWWIVFVVACSSGFAALGAGLWLVWKDDLERLKR
jgi:hypothetical protein